MRFKMKSNLLSLILVGMMFFILQGCGLIKKKGGPSQRENDRGEVTGVPTKKKWSQHLPIDMVPIKAGTFWMGQADEDITYSQSSLNKQITVSEFYMDKFEVSNSKYRQFLNDVAETKDFTYIDKLGKEIKISFDTTSLKPDEKRWNTDFTYEFDRISGHYGDPVMEYYFYHPAFDTYPVVNVSYDQAQQYCLWRTIHLQNKGQLSFNYPAFRLPTEAEWEYAAKGGKKIAKYPWGGPYLKNKRGCLMANFKPGRGNYVDDGFTYTAPVDVFAPNNFGLFNMAGNVSEWVLDAYNPTAQVSTWDLNPIYVDDKEPKKVVRGGSWKDIAFYLETSTRTYEYQDQGKPYIGFRTVMSFVGRSATMDAVQNKRMIR